MVLQDEDQANLKEWLALLWHKVTTRTPLVRLRPS